ncbi:rRNA pseudouridine synthase [bacterium]|nr:rRNA pseudouridine synthase [bacterium]
MKLQATMRMRLNKYLAECGLGSRRKCDDLIAAGKVTVNDGPAAKLGTRIDEAADLVRVAGQVMRRVKRPEYIVLNKPKGYITTASDEHKRKTVLDLVRERNRLFPVGRLDKDSSGLLILTNDGSLSYRLTHPKFGVAKIYDVRLDKRLHSRDKLKLERSIELEEGWTSRTEIVYPDQRNKRVVRITMHQGWKRQIRRMFGKLGYKVLQLTRIGFGPMRLNGMKSGTWRHLSPDEVASLQKATVR